MVVTTKAVVPTITVAGACIGAILWLAAIDHKATEAYSDVQALREWKDASNQIHVQQGADLKHALALLARIEQRLLDAESRERTRESGAGPR